VLGAQTLVVTAVLALAIVVLGLGADGASQWGYGWGVPSQTAFIIFCAVWTILVVLYFMLAPRFFEPAAHPFARVAVDALTMLFWFGGFIAIAVLAGAEKDWGYWDVFDGYNNNYESKYYQVTAAAAAMGAFEWILFVVTTVFTCLEAFRGGHTKPRGVVANPEVQV